VEVTTKAGDVTKATADVTEMRTSTDMELAIVHSTQNIFDLQTGKYYYFNLL